MHPYRRYSGQLWIDSEFSVSKYCPGGTTSRHPNRYVYSNIQIKIFKESKALSFFNMMPL